LPINGATGQVECRWNFSYNYGTRAYGNSYLASSVQAFTAAGNPALLRKTTAGLLNQKK
jgi:hypothetical protein